MGSSESGWLKISNLAGVDMVETIGDVRTTPSIQYRHIRGTQVGQIEVDSSRMESLAWG